jgi:hypothetical protein
MNPQAKHILKQQNQWNKLKWDKLYAKHDIVVITTQNNIIKFSIIGRIFYYDLFKGSIKAYKGKWTTKIMSLLKEEFNTNIPLRGASRGLTANEFDRELNGNIGQEITIKGFTI